MSGRALVTGAGGFVGRRLVRRLAAAGVTVRVLLRPGSASGVVGDRGPVEAVRGDVTDAPSLRAAAAGCDVVFHCAAATWGGMTREEGRRINVDGTRAVVEAAATAGARRVVHVSSMAVHGHSLPSVLDERAPLCRTGTAYSVSKAEAELAAFECGRATGVEIVALRPSLVYGAGAPLWVRGYFERVKSEQVALIDGGAGLANLVHIEDVIEAMLAAAAAPVGGEAFLISGAVPITWGAYLGAFAEMLGKLPPPALPVWRARLELQWSRVSTSLVGRPGRVQPTDLRVMTQDTTVSIAKARARLGYAPRVGIVEGLRRGETWLRDEGYLTSPRAPRPPG